MTDFKQLHLGTWDATPSRAMLLHALYELSIQHYYDKDAPGTTRERRFARQVRKELEQAFGPFRASPAERDEIQRMDFEELQEFVARWNE